MGYVTVSEVRDFIRNDEYTDAQIQAIIDRVSGLVDEFVGYQVGVTTQFTHYFNGDGGKTLVLYEYPVVSVDSVGLFTGFHWKPYDLTAIDLIDERTIQLRPSSNHPYNYFPEGINNIKVTYTVGYTTVPDWVKEYVLLRVADELVPGEYSEALKRLEANFHSSNLV